MEDIRKKRRALEVKRVWELVTRDPHLKRLGDWLVKEEEKTEAEKWSLERKFLDTPWICDLKVILVESPSYDSNKSNIVPFVEIWSNKEMSHANCAFAKMVPGQQQDQVLSPAPPRMSPIPGMSDEEQQGEEKRNFKAGRS